LIFALVLVQESNSKNEDLILALPAITRFVDNYPQAQISCLYLLGLFTDKLPDSVSVIEDYMRNYAALHESVRSQLVTTAMMVFFKRAPEMKDILFHLLDKCIPKDPSFDVKRKGDIYRLLLQSDVDTVSL
jgi:hypothetical protein